MKLIDYLFKKQNYLARNGEVFSLLENAVKDEKAGKELSQKGYTVLPLLGETELAPLRQNLDEFLKSFAAAPASLFYTSGRDAEEKRVSGKQLSWPFIEPYLDRIVHKDQLEIEGCAWLLKPSGDQGGLNPHQDSSLTDESKHASFYGWLPLQDVNKENGTLYVLPGSHLWGNNLRSLDVPWIFEPYTEILKEYCIPVEAKAGEIILFEGALIHGSYPNQTSSLRAALNIFFKPSSVPYLHFIKDGTTPPGKIETYRINMDFFYHHDYRKRPDTNLFPFEAYLDEIKFDLTEKKVRKFCEAALKFAGH